MTPLVMDRIGGTDTDGVPALGVRPEPAHHVRELVPARRRSTNRVTDADLLRGRQPAARVPRVQRRARDRRPGRASPRRGHARTECREPSAVGVRDRARRRDARRDRRSHPARVGAHGRAFSETRLSPKLLADVDRGATGGIAAAPVHIVVCADLERGLEATVASSIFPPCRTCCSRRPRSGSAAR